MKYLYSFDEGNTNMYDLLGKKGVNLSEIAKLGLPVPNGFIITTDACNQYYNDNEEINIHIQEQINEYIAKLEVLTGKKFGSLDKPLLVSVRCGSKFTIPDIMNTILNVGLNENIVESLSNDTDEFIWIWECYLNFIYNYSRLVMGIDLENYQYIKNVFNNNSQLTINGLRLFTIELKKEYKLKTQLDFPDCPKEQLMAIINSTFKSWNNNRANILRRDLDIPFNSGMAIYIQDMVFGNINKNCGVGTVYTRDPLTGEKRLVGNFYKKSQENYLSMYMGSSLEDSELPKDFPKIYKQLKNICALLESYYGDMLKIDFVIENNKLFILQSAIGKRSNQAALKIACDFIDKKKNMDVHYKKLKLINKIKKY